MKLGALRQYCADNMSDAADGNALRRMTRVINAALDQVASGHDWSFYRDQATLVLEASVTGAALGVVLGSDQFTLTGEIWHQKYVDDGWEALVTGESNVLYRFQSLLSSTVALVTPAWVQATDATTAYTVSRSVYDLPAGTSAVDEVRLASSRAILPGLPPSHFDTVKFDQLGQAGDPIYYTVRGDSIEFWPAPTSADTVLLSRRRQPLRVTDTTADTYDVDWPDRLQALLLRAIDVQIVTGFRASTTLEPSLTLSAFGSALARARDQEAGRQPTFTSFGLARTPTQRTREGYVAQRSTVTP
jgi:hypothetical protein